MAGELVLKKGGYFAVSERGGEGMVFTNDPDDCPCCNCNWCDGDPPYRTGETIHFINVPPNGTGPYDLTPFKKRGKCFKLWWLWTIIGRGPQFNSNGCFTGGTNILHASGTIVNKELVGLPETWRPPSYNYEGPTYLVIACCQR